MSTAGRMRTERASEGDPAGAGSPQVARRMRWAHVYIVAALLGMATYALTTVCVALCAAIDSGRWFYQPDFLYFLPAFALGGVASSFSMQWAIRSCGDWASDVAFGMLQQAVLWLCAVYGTFLFMSLRSEGAQLGDFLFSLQLLVVAPFVVVIELGPWAFVILAMLSGCGLLHMRVLRAFARGSAG